MHFQLGGEKQAQRQCGLDRHSNFGFFKGFFSFFLQQSLFVVESLWSLCGVFVDGVSVDGVFVDGVFVYGVFLDEVFVESLWNLW